jgi:hypothetical protein
VPVSRSSEPVLQFLFKFRWFTVVFVAAAVHMSVDWLLTCRKGRRQCAQCHTVNSVLCPKLEW